MSRESTILLLGILVMLVQFTGLPSSWKNALLFLFGAAIAVLAFLLRRSRALNIFSQTEKRADSYVQNDITGIR